MTAISARPPRAHGSRPQASSFWRSPELAVLSLKRIASGDITHAEFLRLLQHYRPEQIVLQRRHFEDEKFHQFLRAFYDVVIEEGNLKYLVRRDWEAARKARLVPNPKPG